MYIIIIWIIINMNHVNIYFLNFCASNKQLIHVLNLGKLS